MQCEANCKNGERCKNKPKGDAFCLLHKECPVCYENRKLVKLSCDHGFCKKCSDKWLSTHSTCPICRKYVKSIRPIGLAEATLITVLLDPGAFIERRPPDVSHESIVNLANILLL